MNDLRIDKLFHDKLASYEVQPSENAWSRVETEIPRKKPKSIWFYAVAASVTVALASTYLILQTVNTSETGTNDYQMTAMNQIPDPVETNESLIVIENSDEDIKKEKIDYTTHKNSASLAIAPEAAIIEENTTEMIFADEHTIADVSIPLTQKEPELNPVFAQSIPDFKLLPEQNTDLTLPENENGFRKVYDYAKRVKNGEENPIDLRKAKEELFAMAKNIKFNQSKTN